MKARIMASSRNCFATVFIFIFFIAILGAGAQDTTRSFEEVTAPLVSKGLNFAVNVVINGRVSAELIIDTGSSFTIVSEKMARRIGFTDIGDAPRYPVSTTAGEAWLRLVVFESVNVGGAISRNVEGAVSSYLGEGMDGVIGLSFLNDFIYKFDGRKKELTLKRINGAGPLKGERAREWWSLRFRRYSEAIRRYRSYLQSHENRLKARNVEKENNETRFTENDLKKIIRYYKKLHRILDKSAQIAGVPGSWKEYP
ncbi:hypothetical protein MNBD_NITROSPINAE04-186 [hydrothermal vent metagenome]|uniref:Peptidase A2 domain-containing protein n=1 Tax=hydrothermal vent metagenome TaxID=652676 RepID=A0A3B1C3P2_9ZZZZ